MAGKVWMMGSCWENKPCHAERGGGEKGGLCLRNGGEREKMDWGSVVLSVVVCKRE